MIGRRGGGAGFAGAGSGGTFAAAASGGTFAAAASGGTFAAAGAADDTDADGLAALGGGTTRLVGPPASGGRGAPSLRPGTPRSEIDEVNASRSALSALALAGAGGPPNGGVSGVGRRVLANGGTRLGAASNGGGAAAFADGGPLVSVSATVVGGYPTGSILGAIAGTVSIAPLAVSVATTGGFTSTGAFTAIVA